MDVTRLLYLYPGEVEIVWSHQGFPPPRVSSSRCKKSSESLSKSAVLDLWGQVLPADDLPGVLPVAQHDRLVHDHPLRRLRLVTPRDSYDVEVRAGERGKSVFMDSMRPFTGQIWIGGTTLTNSTQHHPPTPHTLSCHCRTPSLPWLFCQSSNLLQSLLWKSGSGSDFRN